MVVRFLRHLIPRGIFALLLFAWMASLSAAVAVQTMPTVTPDTTVYVTKTGTKYHTAGCRSLSKSKIPLPLADASQKYGTCGICKPPVLPTEGRPGESVLPVAAAKSVPAVAKSNAQETVYVTKSGTKYHIAGCRSLAKSQIPMSLEEAVVRYGACSICRPPTLSATGAAATAPLPVTSSPRTASTSALTTKSSSQQCAATTKAGSRCKRTASAGSAYCWQHGKTH